MAPPSPGDTQPVIRRSRISTAPRWISIARSLAQPLIQVLRRPEPKILTAPVDVEVAVEVVEEPATSGRAPARRPGPHDDHIAADPLVRGQHRLAKAAGLLEPARRCSGIGSSVRLTVYVAAPAEGAPSSSASERCQNNSSHWTQGSGTLSRPPSTLVRECQCFSSTGCRWRDTEPARSRSMATDRPCSSFTAGPTAPTPGGRCSTCCAAASAARSRSTCRASGRRTRSTPRRRSCPSSTASPAPRSHGLRATSRRCWPATRSAAARCCGRPRTSGCRSRRWRRSPPRASTWRAGFRSWRPSASCG